MKRPVDLERHPNRRVRRPKLSPAADVELQKYPKDYNWKLDPSPGDIISRPGIRGNGTKRRRYRTDWVVKRKKS